MDISQGILCCPDCKGPLDHTEAGLYCPACTVDYGELDGMWDLVPRDSSALKLSERNHYTGKVDYFLHMHATWNRSPFYRHYHACFLDELRILPHASLILETGCGLGHDGLELLRSGYRVVETDISPGQLAQARCLHEAEGFSAASTHLLADAENLPFASGSFDAAFTVASLHHLPDPLTSLREVRRVLKPGGIFVLGTEPNSWQNYTIYPLGKALLKAARSIAGVPIGGEEMVSEADKLTEGFSRRQLEDLLRNAGFTRIELQPAGYLSAAIFFLSTEISQMVGRDIKLFPLERAVIPLDGALGRLPLLSHYPWHWNAAAS
ncbi:MAG: methyltransferase domain-containing protein [Actinobacteria bacterium]|nr:MAG: methyltransferase domain-containing protein [Actinomycetota bacterium]